MSTWCLEGLPPGARVLDLGCGTGTPIARHIVDQGFRLTAVDQSQKMLEIARQVVPDAEFIHGDMIDLALAAGFPPPPSPGIPFSTSNVSIMLLFSGDSHNLLNTAAGSCCRLAARMLLTSLPRCLATHFLIADTSLQ